MHQQTDGDRHALDLEFNGIHRPSNLSVDLPLSINRPEISRCIKSLSGEEFVTPADAGLEIKLRSHFRDVSPFNDLYLIPLGQGLKCR